MPYISEQDVGLLSVEVHSYGDMAVSIRESNVAKLFEIFSLHFFCVLFTVRVVLICTLKHHLEP